MNEGKPHVEISAPEDLMREHGVLNRILLVYEAGAKRLSAGEELPCDIFNKTAQIVRRFVEDYHERSEEKFIFPHFEKEKKLVDLVTILRAQHEAGRRLTDTIRRQAIPVDFAKPEIRQEVIRACEAFIRMYRPHEAREDTILYPVLYEILPAKKIEDLGEQMEEEEHRLFGEKGFENAVEEVAAMEKQLGIHDLAQFTPPQ